MPFIHNHHGIFISLPTEVSFLCLLASPIPSLSLSPLFPTMERALSSRTIVALICAPLTFSHRH